MGFSCCTAPDPVYTFNPKPGRSYYCDNYRLTLDGGYHWKIFLHGKAWIDEKNESWKDFLECFEWKPFLESDTIGEDTADPEKIAENLESWLEMMDDREAAEAKRKINSLYGEYGGEIEDTEEGANRYDPPKLLPDYEDLF
jgi:hypothetical protein